MLGTNCVIVIYSSYYINTILGEYNLLFRSVKCNMHDCFHVLNNMYIIK